MTKALARRGLVDFDGRATLVEGSLVSAGRSRPAAPTARTGLTERSIPLRADVEHLISTWLFFHDG
jgi:hypothetical protein